MASPPFMQLYVADFLADTQHLTTEETGAYLLILMTMWRAGGNLPHDLKVLSRTARLSGRSWSNAWKRLGPLFVITEGHVTQKRLAKEFEKAVQKNALRVSSGARGGAAKALKSKEPPPSNASLLPEHLLQTSDIRKKKPVSSPSQPLQASLLADASETVPSKKEKEAEFGAFYAAFPRKAARGAAETAYWRARKGASAEVLLAGAHRYAALRKGEDPKYTKYPATWLNGTCWLDEAVGGSGAAGSGEDATTPDLWVWRLEAFHHGNAEEDVEPGYWQDKWGPAPGQTGCLVPNEAQAIFRRRHPLAAAGGGQP